MCVMILNDTMEGMQVASVLSSRRKEIKVRYLNGEMLKVLFLTTSPGGILINGTVASCYKVYAPAPNKNS